MYPPTDPHFRVKQVELFGGSDAAGSAVPAGVFDLVSKDVLDQEAAKHAQERALEHA